MLFNNSLCGVPYGLISAPLVSWKSVGFLKVLFIAILFLKLHRTLSLNAWNLFLKKYIGFETSFPHLWRGTFKQLVFILFLTCI